MQFVLQAVQCEVICVGGLDRLRDGVECIVHVVAVDFLVDVGEEDVMRHAAQRRVEVDGQLGVGFCCARFHDEEDVGARIAGERGRAARLIFS